MITDYAHASFHRGITSPKLKSELSNFIFEGTATDSVESFVTEALERQDYLYDPVCDTNLLLSSADYAALGYEALEALRRNVGGKFLQQLNPPQKRQFDSTVGSVLYANLRLTHYEASKPEVWNFITARVLPDLAYLRWSSGPDRRINEGRLLGGDRNAFRRLHHRLVVFDGKDDLLDSFQEDNLTAVFERTSLMRDHDVARSVLQTIDDVILSASPRYSEARVRDFVSRVMRLAAVISIEAIDVDELTRVLSDKASETMAIPDPIFREKSTKPDSADE